MVAAIRAPAAERRLDVDFISERLHESNDSCTPTSTEADENAEDVHVIVVKDSSELLATQLDALDTCETEPP